MIIILDFGSQYTQLIARRIRELNVFSKVLPYNTPAEYLKDAEGIILSGGPNSVYGWRAPVCDRGIWELSIPILGICYGMQLMIRDLGGKVERGTPEYGEAMFNTKNSLLFKNLHELTQVWMSHGDSCLELPDGFEPIGSTKDTKYAAISEAGRGFYGLQFHPEVYHTLEGTKILSNFLFRICNAKNNWTSDCIIDSSISNVKGQVGDKKVLLGLSGGVDSTTLAFLLNEAIGNQLTCMFIDQGFMRLNESQILMDSSSWGY